MLNNIHECLRTSAFTQYNIYEIIKLASLANILQNKIVMWKRDTAFITEYI